MAPFLVMAKAMALTKKAAVLLGRWRALPPDQKADLSEQASEVGRLLSELGAALARKVGRDGERIPTWEEARAAVLEPSPEALVAKAIVTTLAHRREMKTTDLAAAVGATSDDDVFRRGLSFATADGFVERAGLLSQRITEQADGVLADGQHIKALESRIAEYVRTVGLTDSEDLAIQVGASDSSSSAFRAALERALASGEVEWLDASTYGLPRDKLAEFEPPQPYGEAPEEQTQAATSESRRPVKAVAADLSRALSALSGGMSGGKNRGGLQTTPPNPAPRNALYDELRQLGELREVGILTQVEFEEKKALLLRRID